MLPDAPESMSRGWGWLTLRRPEHDIKIGRPLSAESMGGYAAIRVNVGGRRFGHISKNESPPASRCCVDPQIIRRLSVRELLLASMLQGNQNSSSPKKKNGVHKKYQELGPTLGAKHPAILALPRLPMEASQGIHMNFKVRDTIQGLGNKNDTTRRRYMEHPHASQQPAGRFDMSMTNIKLLSQSLLQRAIRRRQQVYQTIPKNDIIVSVLLLAYSVSFQRRSARSRSHTGYKIKTQPDVWQLHTDDIAMPNIDQQTELRRQDTAKNATVNAPCHAQTRRSRRRFGGIGNDSGGGSTPRELTLEMWGLHVAQECQKGNVGLGDSPPPPLNHHGGDRALSSQWPKTAIRVPSVTTWLTLNTAATMPVLRSHMKDTHNPNLPPTNSSFILYFPLLYNNALNNWTQSRLPTTPLLFQSPSLPDGVFSKAHEEKKKSRSYVQASINPCMKLHEPSAWVGAKGRLTTYQIIARNSPLKGSENSLDPPHPQRAPRPDWRRAEYPWR
ncbi:predicted protein [Histoplasma capsulatum var. duboisii H88]|uniref:Predicted protein n=1 Tax=Ajellomyces capsulatus (strain H88) TaxID=544711 RepID=F0US19_AJEC8|nr:predicted protein [Histoplasma capsulatum var. duboisii H88]